MTTTPTTPGAAPSGGSVPDLGTHPPVDVVIATHARPAQVREAVAAVRAQTYPGVVRCLVVHDRAAPDARLVEAPAGHPLRSVDVLPNRRTPGLAGARNSGVLAGSAPLVAFCDDDDTWHPDKLERQVARLLDRRADTSVSGIVVAIDGRRHVRVPTQDEMTVPSLLRRRVMAAHPSTVLVRRDALGRIGLVDEEIPGGYGEDYDWILRAVVHGVLDVVPEPLVTVHWGGSQFARDWPTIDAALEHLLGKHPGFHDDPRALARVRGQQAFAIAAGGQRRRGLLAAARTARASVREPRAYLAVAVALGVPPGRVLDALNRRGRGV